MRKYLLATATVLLAISTQVGASDVSYERVGYSDESRRGIATSNQIIQRLTAKKTNSAFYVSPNIDLSIHFKTGSAELSDQSRVQLVELAEALKNPDLLYADFVIEGHTDDVGAAGLNKSLSKRRAMAVVRALQNDFDVDTDNIAVEGHGESKPIADNATEAGRAENRRVTVVRIK